MNESFQTEGKRENVGLALAFLSIFLFTPRRKRKGKISYLLIKLVSHQRILQ
jgi:hypothetical protein